MLVCGCIFLVKKVYSFYQILKGSCDDNDGNGGGSGGDDNNFEPLAYEIFCLDLHQRVEGGQHIRVDNCWIHLVSTPRVTFSIIKSP